MPHHFNYERVQKMREKYVPYPEVEKIVDPGNDDIILDIGSGDGFYSLNYARKATAGRVYAIEMNDEANSILKDNMAAAGISNIEILQKDVCSGLGVKGFNKVFFSTSFHDIGCHDSLIDELITNSAGKLEITLIEFRKNSEIGPPGNIKLSEEELGVIFRRHGFILAESLILEQHYIHKYSLME